MTDVWYYCAVVDCKSEPSDCSGQLILHNLGPVASVSLQPFLTYCRPFAEECEQCHQSHVYVQADVRVIPLPNVSVPIDWCSKAFRAACIRPGQSETE